MIRVPITKIRQRNIKKIATFALILIIVSVTALPALGEDDDENNFIALDHEIWTQRLLAKHIRENCVKEGYPDLSSITQGTISKILNASNIKPHKIEYYVAKVDPEFDQKAANVFATYREANELSEKFKKKKKLNQ